MKKIKAFYLINIFCILFVTNAMAQYIKAGVHNSTDVYTDITPDDSLNLVGGGIHTSLEGDLILDVDHDGHPDFKFEAYSYGGLGGGSSGCFVYSLDTNNAFTLSRPDTCFVWPGVQKAYPVPVALNYGDSISSNLNYDHDYDYFWGEGYGGFAYPTLNPWSGIGEHYVGFKLFVPGDTLYGWIRVEEYAYEKVEIKDYACNINKNVVAPTAPPVTTHIYPNPANEKVIINTGGSSGRLKLYSIEGALVKDIVITTGQSQYIIETLSLAEGCYILSSQYSDGISSKLIIVKH